MAFPHALGTGLLIQSPLDPDGFVVGGSSSAENHGISNYDAIDILIDEYEQALSRFRMHSLVDEMRRAAHGGSFDFPDWAGPLFDLYDALVHATDGAIDPCIGEDLIRLGYDARYSFHLSPDALAPATGWNLGAAHGRATWREDVERHGTTLITRHPVVLDFGACGKGYLVDLIAQRFMESTDGITSGPGPDPYVIDAGGDLLIQSPDQPLTIALEDPANTENAVGTARVDAGAFCASAPSRRHWEAAGHRLHHLLNAVDGLPEHDVAATWVYVDANQPYPTALADGVATALFTTPPNQLHERLAAYTASRGDSQGIHRSTAQGTTYRNSTSYNAPPSTARVIASKSNTTRVATPDYAAFECAVLNSDRTAVRSAGFPGDFFTGERG